MSTTTTPSVTQSKCAQCQAPTQKKCAGCSSQLDDETQAFTYYCNQSCQAKYWKSHMSSCKAHQARKRLYRAGDTLQEIFYRYRHAMFDKKIVKIERKNGKLYIHEGEYPDMTSNLDILHDFPEKLVQNKEDKQAILTFLAAFDAIAWMKDATELLLKGTSKKIEEIVFTTKNTKREVQRVGPAKERDDFVYPNTVFKVTLQSNGGIYILDLSGAQYGYYSPVTPWSQYIDNRVSQIKSCYPLGTAQTQISWINVVPNLTAFAIQMNQGCSRALKMGMEEWESNSMGVLEFLRLPREEFAIQRGMLYFVIQVLLLRSQGHVNEKARKARENPGASSTAVFTPGEFEEGVKEMVQLLM
ncbi:hypothetical protein OCU04_004663 [Sclerotinia nivalis]|uniref:MYND-type domain-containing protein n=1 Tax=Sclerotinia nivalis TaxID=352851 RepID=A0A9X0DNR7_9HELO|nr:hypothetical protein OCU04_004663 [Sclerotinia nivalis]